MTIKLEAWEDNEYIITVNDIAVGSSVSKAVGESVLLWLIVAEGELKSSL